MPSKLHRFDEYGHSHFLTISCYRRLRFFDHDSIKQVFVNGMKRTRKKHGIRWMGYVIMPEHVHLLVFTTPTGLDAPVPISVVLQDLKQYVGRHGKEVLRSVWRERHSLGTRPMDEWARGDGPKPFWKTRGLVTRAEQWVWSSYRFYEFNDESLIAMDWDGSWPIV